MRRRWAAASVCPARTCWVMSDSSRMTAWASWLSEFSGIAPWPGAGVAAAGLCRGGGPPMRGEWRPPRPPKPTPPAPQARPNRDACLNSLRAMVGRTRGKARREGGARASLTPPRGRGRGPRRRQREGEGLRRFRSALKARRPERLCRKRRNPSPRPACGGPTPPYGRGLLAALLRACGGWPKARRKARRMRSGSPKPASSGDAVDRLRAGLDARAGGLDAQPLDGAGGRDAGLGGEGAGEVARAHRGAAGQSLNVQRLVQPLARPGQQGAEPAARPVELEQGGELRLAARTAVIDHQLLGGRAGRRPRRGPRRSWPAPGRCRR